MHDGVYYSPYKSLRLNGKITIICWQWFDFWDYGVDNFFVESEDGKIGFAKTDKDNGSSVIKFLEKSEAIDWINEHIKTEQIGNEYVHDDGNIGDYLK